MPRNDDDAMEKLVEELGYQVPFKDQTEIGDTVMMLRENEDGRISGHYAWVQGFDLDTSKRDEWWHVHFVFLELPPQARTIILQTAHFTGQEIFTMGGRKIFIKAVNLEAYAEDSATLPQPLPRSPEPDEEGPNPDPPEPSRPMKPRGSFTLVK